MTFELQAFAVNFARFMRFRSRSHFDGPRRLPLSLLDGRALVGLHDLERRLLRVHARHVLLLRSDSPPQGVARGYQQDHAAQGDEKWVAAKR